LGEFGKRGGDPHSRLGVDGEFVVRPSFSGCVVAVSTMDALTGRFEAERTIIRGGRGRG
jgi:hypothetical protein